MDIRVQSVKFDADVKLLEFIDKKVGKLDKFYEDATTFDFLKRAKGIGLPLSELITDRYPLEEINEALKKNLEMTGLKIAVINK